MRKAPALPGINTLAEERIQEAIRRGDFDNLPGAGKPLALDDDLLVAIELRVANRILKNAGLIPVEIYERRELAELEAGLPHIREPDERVRALQKLAILRTKLGASRSRQLTAERKYSRRILEKLAGG